jgi:ribosomal silencing factor RsfS
VDSFEKARRCGRYASEKKAREVVVLELKGLPDIADYFLIGSGTS